MLTLLAASLTALALSAETPVAPAEERGPAAYSQADASIATDGRSFVVSWLDYRSDTLAHQRRLQFRLLGPDGRPISAGGVPGPFIDSPWEFSAVASNGNGYVAAWNEPGAIVVGRLSADLNVTAESARIKVDGTRSVRHLIAGRSRYLMLVARYGVAEEAILLDAEGAVVAPGLFRPRIDAGGSPLVAVALPDGRFAIFWATPAALRMAFVGEDGTTEVRTVLPLLPDRRVSLNAVVGGDRILVMVATDLGQFFRELGFVVLNLDGSATMPIQRIGGIRINEWPPVWAAWDGRQFLAAWLRASGVPDIMDAVRIEPSGRKVDDVPFQIGGDHTNRLFSAWNGARVVLLTEEGLKNKDIVSRVVTSFSELRNASPTPLTTSPVLQTQTRGAAVGDQALVVWRNGDPPAAIRGSIFVVGSERAGKYVDIAPSVSGLDHHSPAVAASSDTFLVAWNEQKLNGLNESYRVLARRISAAGDVLDKEPIVLAEYYASPKERDVAVASDGRDFLVAWPDKDRLMVAKRVLADGWVADPQPLSLTTSGGRRSEPVVVWNGHEYLVFWNWVYLTWYRNVELARVTPAGVVFPYDPRASGQNPVSELEGYSFDLAVAKGNRGLMAVWHQFYPRECLQVMALDLQGRPRFPLPRELECADVAAVPERVSVTWDGSRYLVLATRDDGVRSQITLFALDENGSLIAKKETVTPPDASAFEPASVATSRGVVLLYERISPAHELVRRLFMRISPAAYPRVRGARP